MRSRSAISACTTSPARIFVDGFARLPLTRTCPASHSWVAMGRVLTRRTAHNQRSIRVSSDMACSFASIVDAAEGRSAGRSKRLDRHAGACRLGLDDLEAMRLALLGKEAQAAAKDHRVDEEVELVDEVPLQQPAQKDPAALEQEIPAALSLQVANGRLDVACHDVRGLPRLI